MRRALWQIVKQRGAQELVLLLGLLGLVAATWGFIELADEVREGDTQAFDEWLLRTLRRADDPATPIGPLWLAEVGRDLTALGGVAVLLLLTATVAGSLWMSG